MRAKRGETKKNGGDRASANSGRGTAARSNPLQAPLDAQTLLTQSGTDSAKPRLADHMRAFFKELRKNADGGSAHLRNAAETMGVSYDALRKDLENNRFNNETVMAFSTLAGTSVTRIQGEYEFEEKLSRGKSKRQTDLLRPDQQDDVTLDMMHTLLEAWVDQAFGPKIVAPKIVPNLFRALANNGSQEPSSPNPNAVFIFVANETPAYLDTTELADRSIPEVRNALKAGASIVHLCINDPTIWKLPGNQPITAPTLKRAIENQFESRIAIGEYGALPRRMWAIPHPHLQFALPLHRFVLYLCSKGVFSTLTVPVMGHQKRDNSSYPIVPLDRKITGMLRDIVVKSINDEINKQEKPEYLDEFRSMLVKLTAATAL